MVERARPVITVCGLGPGGEGDLTEAAASAIESNGRRFVRTTRHPTAHRAQGATSFDHVYDAADDLAAVYETIAEALVASAIDDASSTSPQGVVYVVPGSPLVLERSVARLRRDDRVTLELVPSLSFLDVAWARLGIDPVESRVRLVDGHTFAADAAGDVGPLLVAHTHADWVLSDIKLAIDAGPEMRAIVLQGLGTDDERIEEVGWPDLDRVVEPDHLTSIFLPEVGEPVAIELQRSVDLMARLRRECPWDAEQTHRSLRPYLIEETYEVVEAIDALDDHPAEAAVSADAYVDLEEELGDLWFQILFHSQLATEAGAFGVADVARTLREKLIARHPHVFADVEAADASIVARNWEQLKQQEKGRASVMDGIPTALPSLLLAKKVLTKADRTGVPANDEWLDQHAPNGRDKTDIGSQLFALVERARRDGVDPETALREVVLDSKQRFERAELDDSLTNRWVSG